MRLAEEDVCLNDLEYYQTENIDLIQNGMIRIDKKIYQIDNLPKGLVVNGDLDLSGANINKLPDDVTYRKASLAALTSCRSHHLISVQLMELYQG